MNPLFTFYNDQITKYNAKASRLKEQLLASSFIRLGVFAAAALGIYFLFGNTKLVFALVLVTVIVFVFLVSRHSDLQHKRNKFLAIIKINKTEIAVLERKFHHLADGNEFTDATHHFSQDIDLFGKGSFYQYCNRTALTQGSETLSRFFTENCIDEIPEKQLAIDELSKMPEWRQEFSAIASLVKVETHYKTIISWLKKHNSFVPNTMKFLPNILSVVSILTLVLYFTGIISGYFSGICFLIGMLITGTYFKKVSKLSMDTGKIQTTFQQYQQLIVAIENATFTASILKKQQAAVMQHNKKTSEILKDFARILGALDQRNNMIFGILGNGFLLWDLKQSYKIENWIKTYGNDVEQWFTAIAFFDAYNSLGNFRYNHPHYVFPKITTDNKVLNSTKASHPLLDPKKSVPNNITIANKEFFIITGANMAGKSTFLRTVSLQIVMANVGLPIAAANATYTPIKLITSMRTTDSLTDDESYFFSELKRLKFIVDQIQKDRYFIVLDEILKGTNSTDKAIGSQKFIEKLIGSKSTGIIATHDLSLCKTAEQFSQVKNYYFDAEIKNNELHFDYKFKTGICQNMNASFLLKKMGIVD